MPRLFLAPLLRCALAVLAASAAALAGAAVLQFDVDLRDAPRGLLHATLRIPARPGPLTLLYPRWIPGEHGPSGPVVNLVLRRVSADGHRLRWRRDGENMYAFHLVVPPAATAVDVAADFLAPTGGRGAMHSDRLAMLNWNLLALYPAGTDAHDLVVAPRVTLPDHWDFGTSLAVAGREGATVTFQPVTLNALIDQPVLAGANLRRFELSRGGGVVQEIDCAADSEAALAISPARLHAFRRLPLEAAAMLGARYFETYHFLLGLSDSAGAVGLEHHQCSDDRTPERYLVDDAVFLAGADLLPHEYFHSWNGKHRRPAGLLSVDYQQPMHGNLLWVYEGLTNYYGCVLATRAGLLTPGEFRDQLACAAADEAHRSGRTWRPLQDTADAAQLLYGSSQGWSSRRRGVDFYLEGELIWLDADVLIRTHSGGARSLDDFARRFLGDGGTGPFDAAAVPGRAPSVAPYTAHDVYAALNAVLPYDWPAFFAQRVRCIDPTPPLDGLTGAGWKLTYSATPSKVEQAQAKDSHAFDLTDSLGMVLSRTEHSVRDVVAGSPADRAGLAPGMKLLGVNGRVFDNDLLEDAVAAARPGRPIELLVANDSYLSTHRVAYAGGEQHPHLEALPGKPDLLAAIVAPRAPQAPVAP